MSPDSKPKVLLFGAGGVGTVYLWLLSKVSSTTAVCRSNYDAVKKNGFTINSTLFGENIHFVPDVVRNCNEAVSQDAKPYDYIVVCSKAIPEVIPKAITPAVAPGHTVIVLVQNGIGIEDEYATAFPTNPIVSGVVYLPASQPQPGVIKHGEIEKLQLGSYPSSASSKHAEAFVNLIQAAGGTAELYDDVQFQRFLKLIVNAPWNPICALTLGSDVNFMLSSDLATDTVFEIMLEICNVANAYGQNITREHAQHQLGRAKARIQSNTGLDPSMLQDVRAGRRMEVDAIVGNAVKMGKSKGVKVEKLELIYVLLKALDSNVANGKL